MGCWDDKVDEMFFQGLLAKRMDYLPCIVFFACGHVLRILSKDTDRAGHWGHVLTGPASAVGVWVLSLSCRICKVDAKCS